ncbi:hypothetical protein OROMI_016915 [Orobanche minor]
MLKIRNQNMRRMPSLRIRSKRKNSLCKTQTLTNQLRSQILEAVALLNGIIVSVFNE